jgi:GAF domain-containing protein
VSAAPDSRTAGAAEADTLKETRLQSLAVLRLLDTCEERFDRIVRLTQRMFDVPSVVVSLIDERRQDNEAEVGVGKDEEPIAESFCRYTVLDDTPLVVENAEHDPRFVGNAWSPTVSSSTPAHGTLIGVLRLWTGASQAPLGTFVNVLWVAYAS